MSYCEFVSLFPIRPSIVPPPLPDVHFFPPFLPPYWASFHKGTCKASPNLPRQPTSPGTQDLGKCCIEDSPLYPILTAGPSLLTARAPPSSGVVPFPALEVSAPRVFFFFFFKRLPDTVPALYFSFSFTISFPDLGRMVFFHFERCFPSFPSSRLPWSVSHMPPIAASPSFPCET